MATARDKAFRILTERKIREILKDTVERTPPEVDGPTLDRRAKRALSPQVGLATCRVSRRNFIRGRHLRSHTTNARAVRRTGGTWGPV